MNALLLILLIAPAQPAPADAPSTGAGKGSPPSASAPAESGTASAPGAEAGDAKASDAKQSDSKSADSKSASGDGGDADKPDESAAAATTTLWDTLDDIAHSGALGYMLEGGFFMWPILFLGILAAGVIIERYRSLKMLTTDTSALRQRVQEYLQEDRVEEALKLCDAEQGPVPAILSAGLRKFLILRRLNYDPGKIEEQVVKGMDDYGVHIVAALERHLPILATVSSVAPMLGFLGTVQGMVTSFDDIVAQMGKTNIVEAAAAGIKVSLLTTVLGLVVGIPAFMAFNYFTSVINRFVLEVEESASELIEAVTLQLALRRQEN